MDKNQGPIGAPLMPSDKSCKMCGHGMCGCGHHRFFWLRIVLGVIILAAIFCIGIKIGELKSRFGQGFGRRGGYNMMYYPSRPMMRAYPLGAAPGITQVGGTASAAPAASK